MVFVPPYIFFPASDPIDPDPNYNPRHRRRKGKAAPVQCGDYVVLVNHSSRAWLGKVSKVTRRNEIFEVVSVLEYTDLKGLGEVRRYHPDDFANVLLLPQDEASKQCVTRFIRRHESEYPGKGISWRSVKRARDAMYDAIDEGKPDSDA